MQVMQRYIEIRIPSISEVEVEVYIHVQEYNPKQQQDQDKSKSRTGARAGQKQGLKAKQRLKARHEQGQWAISGLGSKQNDTISHMPCITRHLILSSILPISPAHGTDIRIDEVHADILSLTTSVYWYMWTLDCHIKI